jgi:hypothetical protein
MGAGRGPGWDTTWISFSSSPPIPNGDRLWLYYEDRSASHGQAFPFPRCCIGLATLRLDGFASLDAGPSWGWVTTKPFSWSGDELLVNVDAKAASGTTDRAQAAGRLEVEILEEDGSPLEGFSREDCVPFTGDSTAHAVKWNSGRTTRELSGKKIRARFHLLNSQLYSFRAG